jgi:hypothetical protein
MREIRWICVNFLSAPLAFSDVSFPLSLDIHLPVQSVKMDTTHVGRNWNELNRLVDGLIDLSVATITNQCVMRQPEKGQRKKKSLNNSTWKSIDASYCNRLRIPSTSHEVTLQFRNPKIPMHRLSRTSRKARNQTGERCNQDILEKTKKKVPAPCPDRTEYKRNRPIWDNKTDKKLSSLRSKYQKRRRHNKPCKNEHKLTEDYPWSLTKSSDRCSILHPKNFLLCGDIIQSIARKKRMKETSKGRYSRVETLEERSGDDRR